MVWTLGQGPGLKFNMKILGQQPKRHDLPREQSRDEIATGRGYRPMKKLPLLTSLFCEHMSTVSVRTGTGQTQRDHATLIQRIASALGYSEMERRLSGFAKASLLSAADEYCGINRMKRPDRLCHRYREALICFFCQYVPQFPEGFPPIPLCAGPIPKTLNHVRSFASQEPRDVGLFDIQLDQMWNEVMNDARPDGMGDWNSDRLDERHEKGFN
jgi:hypothetical protein